MKNNNEEAQSRKKIKYAFLLFVLAALGILNYQYFTRHISSNPEKIVNFVKEEPVEKFRTPSVVAVFYPHGDNDHNFESRPHHAPRASYLQPRMLIVPFDGKNEGTAVGACHFLQAYKKNIRNVIFVEPSPENKLAGAVLPKDESVLGGAKVSVNSAVVAELAAQPEFKYNNQAFKNAKNLKKRLARLQKVLGSFNAIPVIYGKIAPEALAAALQPWLNRPDTLIIFSGDMARYYEMTRGGSEADAAERENTERKFGAEGIKAAVILSRRSGLYPTLLDVGTSEQDDKNSSPMDNFAAWEDYSKKNMDSPENVPPLEAEQANVKSYAGIYGKSILQIARLAAEAAASEKHYKPVREEYDDRLFDRGASFVSLYDKGRLCGQSGSLLQNQAIAYDVAQNAEQAVSEGKCLQSGGKVADLTLSVALLTGFERIDYKNEEDLLLRLNAGSDGIVIRDGDRQGVFLPALWKQYPERKNFLNNLKIKAGMSPSFWSNQIKVYRFRAVEIRKDEN